MVTVTGDPIIAGDTERTIYWTGLNLDWNGGGYTLKVRTIDPSGTTTDTSLATVSGEAEQAKKVGITGIFSTAGRYRMQLLLYSGASIVRRSEWIPFNVHEAI